MWKLTSGGNDSGALPILDRHGDEVEKDDDCCWKAGRRNAGIDVSAERGSLSALTQRRLAGVNMMCDVDEKCIATATAPSAGETNARRTFLRSRVRLGTVLLRRLRAFRSFITLHHLALSISQLQVDPGLFINCLLRQADRQRESLSTFIPPTPFHSTSQHPFMPPGPHDLRPTTFLP
jgi:hypothetical protein